MKMHLRIVGPDGKSSDIVVSGRAARLGKEPGSEVAFDPATYPMVSGQHARIERIGGELTLTHLSKSNKTLINDQPVDGVVKLKQGDRIRLGYTGPFIEVVALEAQPIAPPLPFVTETISGAESPKSASAVLIEKPTPPTKVPVKVEAIKTTRTAPVPARKPPVKKRMDSPASGSPLPRGLLWGGAGAAGVLVVGVLAFVLTRGNGREEPKPVPPGQGEIVQPEKKPEIAVKPPVPKPPSVEKLAEILKNGSAAERKKALDELSRLGPQARAALAAIMVGLDDQDAEIRARTKDVLTRLGPANKDDVAVYAAALRERSPEVFIYAASQLAALGQHASSELIYLRVLSLDESDAIKKEAAQKAVQRIEEEILPGLTQGLQHTSVNVRSQSAKRLADMGPNAKAALPNLVEAMADSNPAVRVLVVDALQAIGPEAVPVLGEALRDKNLDVRVIAINTLGRMGPDARLVMPELIQVSFETDVRIREEILAAFARMNEYAIPDLILHLERENTVTRQKSLVEVLERISHNSGPAVSTALKSAKPEVVKATEHVLTKIASQPIKYAPHVPHKGKAALIQTSLIDWFAKWDTNKDGFLDKVELAHAMRGPKALPYDYRLPGQPLKKFGPGDFAKYPDYAFLHRVDRNNDGKVSRAEYDRWAYDYADIMRFDLEERARIHKAWEHATERGLSESQRREREKKVAQDWAKYHQTSRAHLHEFHRELVRKSEIDRKKSPKK
jgi:HEAT repeat protein